ncbi:MAG: chemotaxis protein CheB [Magnetococcales bacterium]|nr:chemotaxis protein CheB [Magnetococcales bacterium]
MTSSPANFRGVVIGGSAGSLDAFNTILSGLPGDFPVPIILVQHRASDDNGFLASFLDDNCKLSVSEAEPGDLATAGCVHVAPAGYHLLVETDGSFALTIDPKYNYVRPAIDILFESAADYYDEALLGVLLTGGSDDGTMGLKRIKELGGTTIVQDPERAEAYLMPRSAIAAGVADHVVSLDKIDKKICDILGVEQ